MTTSQIACAVIFYLLAAAAIGLALAVVNSKRLLRAAIYLMGVLIASAGLYVMLGAEFLAGIQVLVYVGGIVVLIVFAVMLTRSVDLQLDRPTPARGILGAIASIAFLALTVAVIWTAQWAPKHDLQPPANGVALIGQQLLTYGELPSGEKGYVLPFEVISLLLLAAVIGGIVVARKSPPRNQPFSTGGDLPGEADLQLPRRQSDPEATQEGRK